MLFKAVDYMRNLGTISFYCDESCYQINDGYSHMAIASVWCRKDRKKEISKIIQDIKIKNGISKQTELKWGKVSPATLNMYKDIFKAIKDYKLLRMRILVTNKSKIKRDARFRWYDTMYYKLIEFPMMQTLSSYDVNKVEVYSDVMNSHSTEQMNKVSQFLKKHFKNRLQFQSKVCESKDITLIQIADLLAGASTYSNRGLSTSDAKMELVSFIENTFKINFRKTTKTKYGEISSYNVFLYDPEVNDSDF